MLLAGVFAAWVLTSGAYASSLLGFLIGSGEPSRVSRAVLATVWLLVPLLTVAGLALLLRAVGTPYALPVALGTAVLLDIVAVAGATGYGISPVAVVLPGVVSGALVAASRPGRRPRERLPGLLVLTLLLVVSAVLLSG